MLTNLNEIKRHLSAGFMLRNRGMGWTLEARNGCKLAAWQMAETLKVPDDLVALLSAQGCIKTELRLVGTATWVNQ